MPVTFDGLMSGWKKTYDVVNCFNPCVDSTDGMTLIGGITVDEMTIEDVAFSYTGGDRGYPPVSIQPFKHQLPGVEVHKNIRPCNQAVCQD